MSTEESTAPATTTEETKKTEETKTMKGCVNLKYSADFENETFGFSEELAFPEAKKADKKILVKVVCAAGNPIDYKVAEGNMQKIVKQTLPYVVGRDFSGYVEAIPEGLETEFKVGDRVCGFMHLTNHKTEGSFAEYCTPLEVECVKIPDEMSFEEATFLLVGATSHQVLTIKGGIVPNKDQKVVILGGSTSAGLIAIQLAKELGCKEIAVTSSSVELCTEYGATKVINYKDGKEWEVELKDGEFDLVFDCMGGPQAYDKSKVVLKKKGAKFVTISGEKPGEQLTVGGVMGTMAKTLFRNTMSKVASGPTFEMFISLSPNRDVSLTYLMALYQAKKLKILIDPSSPYEFSKDGVVKLFTKQKSGTSKGKLVMKIGEEQK